MVTKRKSARKFARKSARKPARATRKAATSVQAQLLETMNDIWLAGLGAVSRAQRGAPQLLEQLITEGARVSTETRGAAEKALRGLVGEVRSTINARLGEARGQAADVLENLEKIFQTRVHRALAQIGVPSSEEVAALSQRVDALNANIDGLAQSRKTAVRSRRHGAAKAATPAPASLS
ncbi:MAG: phasin family protein [Steroidobacterales bacterium]